jgi:hypothetical protein
MRPLFADRQADRTAELQLRLRAAEQSVSLGGSSEPALIVEAKGGGSGTGDFALWLGAGS